MLHRIISLEDEFCCVCDAVVHVFSLEKVAAGEFVAVKVYNCAPGSATTYNPLDANRGLNEEEGEPRDSDSYLKETGMRTESQMPIPQSDIPFSLFSHNSTHA